MNKTRVIEFLNYKVYRVYVGEISRIVFGNDAGIFNNLSGRKVLKRAKLDTLHVENLIKNGFSLLGYDFHDSNMVKKVNLEFQKAIDDIESRSPETRKVSIVEPLLSKVPQVKHLISSDLVKILNDYYGGFQWKLYRAEAWRNYYWGEPTEKEVHSDLMHNDYDSIDILRVFIYLSDGITKENGATKLLSSRNTKKAMRRGYVTRYQMTRIARKHVENKSQYMEGDFGFSFIFNPQMCLHAAGRVSPKGKRDVLVLSFCKSNMPFTFEQVDDLERDQKRRLEDGLSIEWK